MFAFKYLVRPLICVQISSQTIDLKEHGGHRTGSGLTLELEDMKLTHLNFQSEVNCLKVNLDRMSCHWPKELTAMKHVAIAIWRQAKI